jgi:Flp pilus assembly protein TadD
LAGLPQARLVEEAQALAAQGDRVGALDKLCALIDGETPDPEILLPGAFGAFQLGDYRLAEKMLRHAITLRPEMAPAHLNLANVLQSQGHLSDAVSSLNRALDITPNDPVALGNLAGVFEQMGRPDRAEPLFRRAFAIQPDDPVLGCAVARTIEKQARLEEALSLYAQVAESSPAYPPVYTSMGILLQKAKRLGDAEMAYRQALEIDPGHSPARQNLAVLFQELGRLEEAEAHLRRVANELEEDPLPHINLARVLYDGGKFREGAAECDEALRLRPANGLALALKASCLAEAGDMDGAAFLTDMERLVTRREFPVPSVYASREAFNTALFDQASSMPDRYSEPGTDLARQTRDLMIDPTGPLAIFRSLINDAVSEYISDHAGLDHPFTAIRPTEWRLESWATILRQIKPGEDTHSHQTAWLSGVYYVRVPEEIDLTDKTSGWIEFGRPPKEIRHSYEPGLTLFPPLEGTLILFPAYFYHRVLPFTAEQHRMSIAFDVIPTRIA